MICPVMKSAAGETRNRAARATSSGVPHRLRRHSRAARLCQYSEARAPQAVLIQPGARQFTRTSGARDCQAPREGHDRSLHGTEQLAAVPRHATVGPVPADVQQDSAFRRPSSARRRTARAGSPPPHRLAKGLRASLSNVLDKLLAGEHVGPRVIDPDLHSGSPTPSLFHQRLASGGLGQIGKNHPCLGALGAKPAGNRLGRLAILAAMNDHCGPGPHKFLGNRPADSAG